MQYIQLPQGFKDLTSIRRFVPIFLSLC